MAEDQVQARRLRELQAAGLILDAKTNEHMAACLTFDAAAIERGRSDCLAALEAVLDRKQVYVQGAHTHP